VSGLQSIRGNFKYELFPEIKLEASYVDGKRYYITPEGHKYRSVTTALSAMSADKIAEWRNRVGNEEANRISTRSSNRGTKLHKLCEDYVLSKQLELEVNQLVTFNPIKEYLEKYMDVVYGVELGLYSNTLQLAGRCDLVGRLHGLPCIIDFKTASKPKKEEWITNYFFQTTAYAQMVTERYQMLVKWVCILIVTEDGELQVFYRPVKNYYKNLLVFLKEV
jgi:genome maintenance exonuclease 1